MKQTESFYEGIFGLKQGMSIDEIRESDFGDVYQDRKDPKSWYVRKLSKPKDVGQVRFFVTSEDGLLRISFGWTIKTNIYGDRVKEKFNELYDILAKKYGKGEKLDYLKPGSYYEEPRDWVEGLLREERVLSWVQRDFANLNKWNLNTVSLKAKAFYDENVEEQVELWLHYEFQSFSEYKKKRETEEASQF